MPVKPASLPQWNSGGANRTTPPGAKLILGYVFGEEPSSAYDNWFQNLVYTWVQYLDAPVGVTTTPAMTFVSGSGAGSQGIRVGVADATNSAGVVIRAGTVTDGALDSLLTIAVGAALLISSTNTNAIYVTTTAARAIFATAGTFGVHGRGGSVGVETAGVYGEGLGTGAGTGTHGVMADAGGGSGPNYGILARAGSAGGGAGVRGEGNFVGNAGVQAVSLVNAYALQVIADTTSPIKAAIHVDPQNAQPTGAHVVGDWYVDSLGSIWACIVAGTPGTWARVGPRGTATNDNAVTACVGEFVEATVADGGVGSWTTNVAKNITSISLTAGDWDVTGLVTFGGGAITGSNTIASISTVTNTLDAQPRYTESTLVPSASGNIRLPHTRVRLSLSATTTVYLVGRIVFTAGTPTAGGYISARRAR